MKNALKKTKKEEDMRTPFFKLVSFMLVLSFFSFNVKAENPPTISPHALFSINQENELVKGKVIDTQGLALIGATVKVKNTAIAALTDTEGYYAIKANPGDVLVFSYLGFVEQEITVPNKMVVDVVMAEDLSELEEVVVVGMGTQRKASVIGSISSVNISDIKVPNRSLINSLSGRLAGLVAVQRSGEPGYDNSEFWIRGIATFGANKTPLVLVDGVERSMNDLSPEEIESVTVLKDASATAVYGVRAANGVILVTTRKGIASAKPIIEFKAEYGVTGLSRVPKLLRGGDYTELYNEAIGFENFSKEYIENTRLGTDPYLYPDVDWFNEIFKDNSNNMDVSLSVRGGGEIARYFVNFGFFDESGNFKDDPENDYKSNIKLQRYNFRSNVDVSITKSTTLDLEVGGSLTDTHYPGTGTGVLFGDAYRATPIVNPVKYPYGTKPDGSTNWVWAGLPSGSGDNPAERLLGSGFATEFRNQFMGQVRLTQDLDKWVKGLKLNVALSFDAYNKTNTQRRKKASSWIATGRNDEGELELTQTHVGNEYLGFSKDGLENNRAMEIKSQATYDRIFKDVHRVGAMFMYHQRDYRNGNADNAIGSLPFRKQGISARATYSYDDRYFAEFNMGYNGSENFPKNGRYGFFPAGSIGYLISNESFWSSAKLDQYINVLKFKASTGLVGAEALPNNRRYGYLTIVGDGLGGYNFGHNNQWYSGTGENQLGVTNLTWEKGLKTNVGFESQFFGGLISFDMDYFHEKRNDILIQRTSLPGIVGLTDNPFANLGEMQNQGFDGTLTISDKIGDFGFKVYGNITYTKNKVLDQDEPDWKYTYQNRTGHKFEQHFGLIALGYFKDQADINNSPRQSFGDVRPGDVKYKDINGDGIVDSYDEVPIGYSRVPELVYGFGTQFEYKGFDLGVFFRGQSRVSYALGGEGFIPFAEGGARGNLFEEALDRWTVDNPSESTFYPRLSYGNVGNNYRKSTKWIYSGSFLRLADVEVGYNLPKKILKDFYISGLRVYVLGNNLAVFSPWKTWDPELGKERGDAYPLQRKINFGIRATF